jgi:hypothetical protein
MTVVVYCIAACVHPRKDDSNLSKFISSRSSLDMSSRHSSIICAEFVRDRPHLSSKTISMRIYIVCVHNSARARCFTELKLL